jgi:hypothetical protein
MNKKQFIPASVLIYLSSWTLPALSLDLPQGASLVPQASWPNQPSNGKADWVLAGQVQGVWGCVKFAQLRPGFDVICGYLSIYPTPPGTLKPGQTWKCTPGTNVLVYSFPFNRGTCLPYGSSAAPPANSFSPKPYQIYQSAADQQVLGSVANGQSPSVCLQADGTMVYRLTPNSVEVKLKTYIPSQAVSLTPAIPTLIYGGDNRSSSYKDTTFRSFQSVIVDPTKSAPQILASRDFGESTAYNPLSAKWAQAGKPWWWWNLNSGSQPIARATDSVNDSTNKITVTKNSTGTNITYYLRGANPLNIAAPPIDINLTINVRKAANGSLQYQVTGGHDGFPAYELYVNGKRAYEYDPIKSNKSPLDLFGGPDEVKPNIPWTNVSCGNTI